MAEKYGIKVMLDVHSAEADNSGHIYPVWWKGAVTTEQFYAAWEWVTARYRDNDTLVAMDVKNEPHGKQSDSPRAKWDGSTDQDNFKYTCETAGRRILAVNPHVLVMCEGVEIYPKDGTNWTSTSARRLPRHVVGRKPAGCEGPPGRPRRPTGPVGLLAARLRTPGVPAALVQGEWDRTTLERDVWDPNWLYLHKNGTAPLFVGEWGGHLGRTARTRSG